MFSELQGKRLLVLGGSAWLDIIKAFANENEIKLISVGNDSHSPLASLEEYHNIDSTDHDAMKRFIVEAHIDGVYIGSNETVIRHAIQYLADLGMPHYCNVEQWDALMNKRSFKDICKKNGIPVAPSYDWKPGRRCRINYPVIVKPADGCASVGITICHNEEDLMKGYKFALKNSPSEDVIIEKLVNNSGMDVFFQITNGKIEWCGLGDKYPVQFEEGAGSVAGARVFPSLYTKDFRNRFEEKLRKIFMSLGLYQGLIWMEVFRDGEEYCFNEVGYRPNGSLSVVGIDYLCGINTVAADIYYALTGKGVAHGFPSLILKNVPSRKKKVCEYWIALNPGTIGNICGIEELRKYSNILALFPKYEVGSIIPRTNGFAQNFCVIHFAFDNADEMRKTIKDIRKTIKVVDMQGNDMIIHKSQKFINNLITSNM